MASSSRSASAEIDEDGTEIINHVSEVKHNVVIDDARF